MAENYDALLLVSFGGPEGRDEVIPFLENVLRGKPVPRERMLEVAEHYYHFDGVSPINEQNRQLLRALESAFAKHGIDLPIYWGNRNWHPLLTDTLTKMQEDGVGRCLAFVTSAFSSYSGCRQYRENIEAAREQVDGENAPTVDKLRVFFNHPGFVGPTADRVNEALGKIDENRRSASKILFTAHSIPIAMADGCRYVEQLNEACRLVMEKVGDYDWRLVYQSRSGPPSQPWLEPDVCDVLEELADQGETQDVVVAPIGFISDHMEVLFDLDTEARELCDKVGLNMIRAATVGTDPRFVEMICQLVLERTQDMPREALGTLGPSHDVCPIDCCPSGRPAARPTAAS